MGRWKRVSIYDVRDREDASAEWRIIYIGSTSNLRARMAGHRNGGKVGAHCNTPGRESNWLVRVKYSENRRFGENLMREARLIRRVSPIFNKRGC